MSSAKYKDVKEKSKKDIATTFIVFAVFCCLSFLSRLFLPLFLVVLVFGIAFPLLWARKTKGWRLIGFKQKNRGQAFLWGLAAGIVIILYCILSYFIEGGGPLPSMLELQLVFGIPIWLLIMSPFQEFFFRGWMQPQIIDYMGKWPGLIGTSFCFAIWHLFPPFEGTQTSTIPIVSVSSMMTIFAFGMIWGYSFQRTKNIITPWIAHAIAGITMVALGKMTFITFAS